MRGLSIVFICGLVNAQGTKASTFREVHQEVRRNGADITIPDELCDDLALPRGTGGKFEQIDVSSTADQRSRAFAAIEGGAVLISRKIQRHQTDDITIRLDETGIPTHAFSQKGEVNTEGNGIAGSAKVTHLSVVDKAVKKRIAAELDFWLKGKGRKKSADLKK
jgi:hypothetical protein